MATSRCFDSKVRAELWSRYRNNAEFAFSETQVSDTFLIPPEPG